MSTDQTTDQTDATEVEEPTDQTKETEVTEDQAPGAEEKPNGNAEAAKYRRALRAAEKERDTLAERVRTMQTAEAERIAATLLADGSDLWREGTDLAALLDDDGNLDHAKVQTSSRDLIAAKPHWGRRTVPASRLGSGAAAPKVPEGNGWAAALRGNRGGNE